MSLRANVFANYAGQGWRALMALAFVPVYVKHLGIQSYALVGLYTVLLAWLQVMDMGLRPAVAREMARYRGGALDVSAAWDLVRSVEAIVCVMAAALLLAGSLLSGWLATSWFHGDGLPPERVAHAFTLMAAVVSLQFIEGIYSSALSGLERQVALNALTSIAATVRAFGAVAVLLWVSPTIEAFFMWQVTASVISLLMMAVVTYRTLGPSTRRRRVSSAALSSVWGFSAGMMGIALLSLLLTQIDKVLLSRQLPLAEVGFYVLAAAVAGAVSTLSSPVGAAYYPRLVALASAGDKAALAATYHRGSQLMILAASSAAGMLIAFGDRILIAWTGDPALTHNVYPIMRVLAVGTMLNATMNVPYLAQLAHGWTSLTIRANVISVAVLVPTVLWTVPRYGAIGAAVIWATLNASYLLFVVPLVHRKILVGEKWRWYLRDLAVPVGAMAAAAIACRLLLPATIEHRLVEVILLAIAYAIIVGAGVLALAPTWTRRPHRAQLPIMSPAARRSTPCQEPE